MNDPTQDREPAQAAPRCEAVHHRRMVRCKLEWGHRGRHRAGSGYGEFSWSTDTATDRTEAAPPSAAPTLLREIVNHWHEWTENACGAPLNRPPASQIVRQAIQFAVNEAADALRAAAPSSGEPDAFGYVRWRTGCCQRCGYMPPDCTCPTGPVAAPSSAAASPPTCEWSVSGGQSFRCVLPAGHNGLHQVVFGDDEHIYPQGAAEPVQDVALAARRNELAWLLNRVGVLQGRSVREFREDLQDIITGRMNALAEIGEFSERLRRRGAAIEAARLSLIQRLREFVADFRGRVAHPVRDDYDRRVPLDRIETLHIALAEYDRVQRTGGNE